VKEAARDLETLSDNRHATFKVLTLSEAARQR
jgi:hypothetical protein